MVQHVELHRKSVTSSKLPCIACYCWLLVIDHNIGHDTLVTDCHCHTTAWRLQLPHCITEGRYKPIHTSVQVESSWPSPLPRLSHTATKERLFGKAKPQTCSHTCHLCGLAHQPITQHKPQPAQGRSASSRLDILAASTGSS